MVKLLEARKDSGISKERNNLTEGESLTRGWKHEGIRIKENARDAAEGGEAKKQARKQRLLDIEEGIEFAAAVAFQDS
ncbi:hypothetical protein EHO60_02035 [Leptospira fletcheri]|uniref:Uncharacterized protein n=1 Tax=Leptospira fletcheri TaxID=2484981 RepID=A0A4R9GK70_9LEPT|nr:hypothetical protein [Leptospira fletcheri]TGK14148.1 hypothetical protein EHO60_02035 [Leptospira fletcheri]